MNSLINILKVRTLSVFFLGLVSSLVAYAKAPEMVSVQFSALSWGSAVSDLFYMNNGQPIPVLIPNGAPSLERSYTGPPTIDFFMQTTDAEGQPVYTRKASVAIPDSVSRLMLIFVLESNPLPGQPTYRVLALPDQDGDFQANAFNFTNLTDFPIAVRLGKETLDIRAGGSHIVSLADAEARNVDVQMAANREGTDWKLIYRSRWASPVNRRAWVFVYADQNDSPKVRKYYQVTSRRRAADP